MRSPVQTEWALDHPCVPSRGGFFGLLPLIGLLATPLKSQVPVIISPFPDPAAFTVDALSVPWDSFRTAYAFPATALVHGAQMKLQGLDLTLIFIAPWWPISLGSRTFSS